MAVPEQGTPHELIATVGVEQAIEELAVVAADALPTASAQAMLAVSCLLVPWALGPDGVGRASSLCPDGTPIECSVAVDSTGNSEFRMVADISNGTGATNIMDRRRMVADRCRLFAGSDTAAELIGHLADLHLRALPPDLRPLAVLGAGAAAEGPVHRMFYFNLEGAAQGGLGEVLSRVVGPLAATAFDRIAERVGKSYYCVGYDLQGDRVSKMQLYLPFTCLTGLTFFGTVEDMGLDGLAETARFSSAIFEDIFRNDGRLIISLGMRPHDEGSIVPRLCFPLASKGMHSFADLEPVLQRIEARWGNLIARPDRCTGRISPTMLSMTATSAGERIAIYFKPDGLGARA